MSLMVMHLSMFMMSLRLSFMGISLSCMEQTSDPLSSLGSRTVNTVSSNALRVLVMLVSYVVAQFHLNMLIIKLLHISHCSISPELVEASGVHLAECVADTTQVTRAMKGHLVEGVIIVSRLLVLTSALALGPLDATNGWDGFGFGEAFTILLIVIFVGYLLIHHTKSICERWVDVNCNYNDQRE